MATLVSMNPRLVSGPVMATVDLYIDGIDTYPAWAAGQFLRVTDSGLLWACISTAASVASNGGIQYYALSKPAIGAAGTDTVKATVGVITPDMEFEGNELDTTAAITDIGKFCGINVTSPSATGSKCTVDISNTNAVIVLTNIGYLFDPAQYTSSDTLAKLRFKVMTTAINAVRVAAA
jgi:hypothetical protein